MVLSDYEDMKLDETSKLGEALLHRVQWRRSRIIVKHPVVGDPPRKDSSKTTLAAKSDTLPPKQPTAPTNSDTLLPPEEPADAPTNSASTLPSKGSAGASKKRKTATVTASAAAKKSKDAAASSQEKEPTKNSQKQPDISSQKDAAAAASQKDDAAAASQKDDTAAANSAQEQQPAKSSQKQPAKSANSSQKEAPSKSSQKKVPSKMPPKSASATNPPANSAQKEQQPPNCSKEEQASNSLRKAAGDCSQQQQHVTGSENPTGDCSQVVFKESKKDEIPKAAKKQQNKTGGTIWTRPNPKFKYGFPMLTDADLKSAGTATSALHGYYLQNSKGRKNSGIVVKFKNIHLFRSNDTECFPVGFNDLYDLFNIEALDVSLLRCFTL
ncbi:unnamed protein product [Urochloa humidicola]